MTPQSIGNTQVRWERGHPLIEMLRGHFVRAVTPVGAAFDGVLTSSVEGDADSVDGIALHEGVRLFHSMAECGCSRPASPSGGSTGERGVHFLLARLHHRLLHNPEARRAHTGIRCPTCRLEYFTLVTPPPAHTTIMAAGAVLYQDCPDHRTQFDVPD